MMSLLNVNTKYANYALHSRQNTVAQYHALLTEREAKIFFVFIKTPEENESNIQSSWPNKLGLLKIYYIEKIFRFS